MFESSDLDDENPVLLSLFSSFQKIY